LKELRTEKYKYKWGAGNYPRRDVLQAEEAANTKACSKATNNSKKEQCTTIWECDIRRKGTMFPIRRGAVGSNVDSNWSSACELNIRGEGTSAKIAGLGQTLASSKKRFKRFWHWFKNIAHCLQTSNRIVITPQEGCIGVYCTLWKEPALGSVI
jgi:hypothetical protein